MRILLTNDDGINAPGISALYQALCRISSVMIVAPDSQRSSVGHGITLLAPVTVKKVPGGYATSGTPADCVKLALGVLMIRKPDIVISGINLGPNDGCSVFYSGTVAGAREGALNGIPSIAVSLDTFVDPDFSYAARFTVRLAQKVHHYGLRPGTFLNLNIPHCPAKEIKGVRITRQGQVPIHTSFSRPRSLGAKGRSYLMSGDIPRNQKDLVIDTVALKNKYISITPIQNDLTDQQSILQISSWRFH